MPLRQATMRLPQHSAGSRDHRCRRPAELAGATGAAERRWHRAMAVSAERHRALRLLVAAPNGATEAIPQAALRSRSACGTSTTRKL